MWVHLDTNKDIRHVVYMDYHNKGKNSCHFEIAPSALPDDTDDHKIGSYTSSSQLFLLQSNSTLNFSGIFSGLAFEPAPGQVVFTIPKSSPKIIGKIILEALNVNYSVKKT